MDEIQCIRSGKRETRDSKARWGVNCIGSTMLSLFICWDQWAARNRTKKKF